VTSHSSGGGILLAVTNNTFTYLEVGGSYLRTDLPGVLPPAVTLQQGSGSAKSSLIDLNGNDQTVGQLRTGWSGPESRILYSEAPATLTVNQSANTDYNASITGAVSLVKTGTGNLTISGTSTTFGSFFVNAGLLTVSSTGTFGVNSTNIVAAGTGTLMLENSNAIADTASLSINNGAHVTLASGINETVRYLNIDGIYMPIGTYGATGSSAQYKDDTHFAGAGILTVLRSANRGSMIIFR
jgi:autotransporter-associated beta strand protein